MLDSKPDAIRPDRDGSCCHGHDRDDAQDRAETAGCCGGGVSQADDWNAGAGRGAARLTFKVQGLDCAEEVAILKREVGPLVGGEDRLAFDVLNGRMMVLDGAPVRCSPRRRPGRPSRAPA